MKAVFGTILFLFIILSCNTNDRSIEDQLYQCMLDHYESHNIDLETSLDSLEDYLISNGILASKGGSGKIEYYKEIARNGAVPSSSRTKLMRTLSLSYIGQEKLVNCLRDHPSFDSLSYHQSSFSLTSEKITNHVKEQGSVNPKTVSTAFVEHLTAADFDHPFYRAHMLTTFVMTSDRDKAYIRKVPKKLQGAQPNYGGFVIDISTDDTYLVNDAQMEKSEVETALFDYLQEIEKPSYVTILVHANTRYRRFADVQVIVLEAYNKFWNQISLKEHQTSFDQLSSLQKDSIKSRYPAKLIEALAE